MHFIRKSALLVLLAVVLMCFTACVNKEPQTFTGASSDNAAEAISENAYDTKTPAELLNERLAGKVSFTVEDYCGDDCEIYPFTVHTEMSNWYLRMTDIESMGEDKFFAGLEEILKYQDTDFREAVTFLDTCIRSEIEPVDIYTDFGNVAAISGTAGAYYNLVGNFIKMFHNWEKAGASLLHEYVHYLTIYCCDSPVEGYFFREGIADEVAFFRCINNMARRSGMALDEVTIRSLKTYGSWDYERDCLDTNIFETGMGAQFSLGSNVGYDYGAVTGKIVKRTEKIQNTPRPDECSYYEAAGIVDMLVVENGLHYVVQHTGLEEEEFAEVYGRDFDTIYDDWVAVNLNRCREYGIYIPNENARKYAALITADRGISETVTELVGEANHDYSEAAEPDFDIGIIRECREYYVDLPECAYNVYVYTDEYGRVLGGVRVLSRGPEGDDISLYDNSGSLLLKRAMSCRNLMFAEDEGMDGEAVSYLGRPIWEYYPKKISRIRPSEFAGIDFSERNEKKSDLAIENWYGLLLKEVKEHHEGSGCYDVPDSSDCACYSVELVIGSPDNVVDRFSMAEECVARMSSDDGTEIFTHFYTEYDYLGLESVQTEARTYVRNGRTLLDIVDAEGCWTDGGNGVAFRAVAGDGTVLCDLKNESTFIINADWNNVLNELERQCRTAEAEGTGYWYGHICDDAPEYRYEYDSSEGTEYVLRIRFGLVSNEMPDDISAKAGLLYEVALEMDGSLICEFSNVLHH